MIETYRGTVYPYQIDHMGHMNVQYYVSKFDEATWNLFTALGITSNYMKEKNRGMVAVEQKINYKAEALSGDCLYIKSKVLEIGNKSIRFIHYMYNTETGIELASCELIGVHIDRNTRKSCPFPASLKNTLNLTNEENQKDPIETIRP